MILCVDASPNWERHLFFITLKGVERNLQKKFKKNAAFCTKMIDFARKWLYNICKRRDAHANTRKI